MVRPELVVDLRTAIYKARKEGVAVHKDAVEFKHEGRSAAVRLEVQPLKRRNVKKQDLLVVFQRVEPAGVEKGRTAGRSNAPEAAAGLERELVTTREQLRGLIAEHETAEEEMKAANEEILSSNEELQSTNEELETAKEELQSANEELVTLNDELQHRNQELTVLTHDLSNLLVGVDIPILVLDADLHVRRFTPMAGSLLNLIPGDVGRPFSDIASNLDVGDWNALLSEVTGRGRTIEREVQDREGHRYSMRVRPYKTGDNRIEGVLVVMLDTDLIYRARDQAQKSGDYARAIVDTIYESLIEVDSEFQVVKVNHSFCDLFQVSPEETEGQSLFKLGQGQWDVPGLRKLLEDALSKSAMIKDFEIDREFPGIGRRHLVLNVRKIETSQTILIAIRDFTARQLAQELAEKSQASVSALLGSARESIFSVNQNERIVLANGNVEKMFGYRPEELIGQPFEILIPESSRQRAAVHRAFFAAPQTRPVGIGLNLEGRKKDGATFPVEIGLSAMETAAGKHAVAFVSDITERKRLEQVERTHAEEVQALAARLLTAQEEERRRVSRELHDQICQQLASLAIAMGGLAAERIPEPVQRQLKALQSRVVKASEETRHIAYELHPSMLEDLGLATSLRELCKEFSERNPEIALEFTGAAQPAAAPREAASCFYRVAQECLHNIAQHAGAKRVSVALEVGKEAAVLTIADDGIGFDPAVVKGRGGLGLIGMEERVRLVHGKLSIAAQPGRGTRTTVEIPLPLPAGGL